MKNVAITFIMLTLIGCGSSGSDSSGGVDTNKTSTGCPVGSWVALNYSDRITVGNDGMITINQNASHGISTGYVTCNMGQNFVMSIESVSGVDYQPIGVYQCHVSLSTNLFTIYCPSDIVGNIFATSKEYMVYQW